MAIRNIGGQSVYVIEAQPITAAKTSTGAGYAQLVSQLRWQIWEEAQKQILRELEFEKMTYQSQLDVYENQRKELDRQLSRARELKLKSDKGEISQSELLKALKAEADLNYKYDKLEYQKVKDARIKYTTKPVRDSLGDPVLDELGNPVMETTTVEYKPGEEQKPLGPRRSTKGIVAAATEAVRKAEELKNKELADANVVVKEKEKAWMEAFNARTDKNIDAATWAKSPEGQKVEAELAAARQKVTEVSAKVPETKDADIQGLISQLEKERGLIEAPRLAFDTNVLSRTREQFGGMAGVGGFGFAPRPSKISPIYDEGRAKEALARFQPAAEDVILESAAQKAADQEASILSARSQRALELQAAGAPQEQIDALKTLTNEEKTAIQRSAMEIAQKEFRESALSAGPGPRTAGTFMDRPRPEAVARPDFVRQKREKKERDFKFPEFKGLDLFQYPDGSIPSTSFGLTGTAESGLGFSGGPIYGGSGAGGESLVDIELLKELLKDESIRPSFDVGASGEAGLGFEPPKPEPKPEPIPVPKTLPPEPKVSADDDKKIGAEQAEKEFAIQYGPVKQGTSEMIPVDPKINRKIYEAFLQEAPFFPGTQQESDAAGRAWYQGKLDEFTSATPAQGRAKPKTRTEKYASSSLAILKKGSDLAEKPSKLARLAKLDLPEKERSKQVPEHILLVDKLYQINKGKTNAYKSTFDEIARVYSKDDKKKKEAQEYLTATHLLYTEGLV
jgi:hypothetical protein